MFYFIMAKPVFYLFLDSEDTDLKQWYKERIKAHNEKVNNDPHPDSGFDLACPNTRMIAGSIDTTKIVTNIKGKMIENDSCCGFYLYPRSSLSKTPLVLSNHVGIIDSGYRGNLTGAFRNLSNYVYTVNKYDRLLQICHSSLKSFYVVWVDNEEEIGVTARGEGGFGSTGK